MIHSAIFPTLRRLEVPLLVAPRDCRPLSPFVVRLEDMYDAARKMGKVRKCPQYIYAFKIRKKNYVFADFAEDVLKRVEKGYDFRKKVGE